MSDTTHQTDHAVRERQGRRFVGRAVRRSPALGAPVYEVSARGAILAREAVTRRVLVAADAAAAVLAVLGVFLWNSGRGVGLSVLLFVPLIVFVYKVAGLYERDDLVLQRSTLDEVPRLLQAASIFALCVAAVGEPLFGSRLGPQQVVVLWLTFTLLTTAFRMGARASAQASLEPERCLVVGDADRIEHVCSKIDTAAPHADVVAAMGLRPGERAGISRLEDLRSLIEQHDVHRVVIAPVSSASDTVELVRIAKAVGVRVSILPRVLEAVGSAVEFEQLDGLTMLGVRRFKLSRSSKAIKRAFDLAVGGLILVAVLPILVAVAVAIRLDSHGPIFFRQIRIGRNGKPFYIWKFRSMVDGADDQKDELLALNEVDGGMFKIAEDPRVTRVGRFLRKTSLDELPQIFNVITGEVSLVGPRPLVADEDALVEGIYRMRLHLTPGMTGPWQILGSTRVPMDEMVGIDYLYVANWSLWADVKLLLRTVPHMVARKGL